MTGKQNKFCIQVVDRNLSIRYPTNASQYNNLQVLNAEKMRFPIPFIQMGECLHGLRSGRGTVFPQQIGMAATFDPDLVFRAARAIGSEARATGIHACFAPVLDLGKELRWGRVQEDFGGCKTS